jgi:glucan biosynthesis protein C
MNQESSRITYLDNIRILLTATVIFHHLLITYGAPGGWYYHEFEFAQLDPLVLTLLVLITAANQAYFMGFFFFISGYFSSKSIQNKDTIRFLIQRLLRLGIPILLFVYLISPLLRILFTRIMFNQKMDLLKVRSVYQQLRFGYELGPMWFVLLLLILTILFLPFQKRPSFSQIFHGLSDRRRIVLFAIVSGVITFLVRIRLPVGYVFQPLNLQIPHVTQYIFMFLAGILAFHGNWLDKIEQVYSRGWPFLILGLILIMPLLFFLSGGLEGDVTPALGGFHWQSLAYSLWEQLFCVSMIVTLLYFFKTRANRFSRLTREMAASSYAAFFIHPLILVTYSALIHRAALHPLIKISISVFPVLVLCFLAASVIRRIPGLNSVL